MAIEFHFDEILLDPKLFNLGAASGGPEFANANLRSQQSGIATVAVIRFDPSLVWQCNFEDITFEPGQPSTEGMAYFNNMWYGGLGSAYGFRVKNHFDYFTEGEVLAEGDGVLTDFRLTKKYQRPGTTSHPYIRRIIKPVVSTHLSGGSVTLYEPDGSTARVIDIPFAVYLDSGSGPVAQTTGFTIDNTTGILHFTSPPGMGVFVSVDFQFDVPMQFFQNNVNMTWDFPGTAKGIAIIEILPESLGIT